jgi:hypothetical protein
MSSWTFLAGYISQEWVINQNGHRKMDWSYHTERTDLLGQSGTSTFTTDGTDEN